MVSELEKEMPIKYGLSIMYTIWVVPEIRLKNNSSWHKKVIGQWYLINEGNEEISQLLC